VPILKQINRHNQDGSYSYGYEAADGSFKIETKSASGEVKGKYGYVDADGNLREISYGADRNGFVPEVILSKKILNSVKKIMLQFIFF
jgi:hypothetical protein